VTRIQSTSKIFAKATSARNTAPTMWRHRLDVHGLTPLNASRLPRLPSPNVTMSLRQMKRMRGTWMTRGSAYARPAASLSSKKGKTDVIAHNKPNNAEKYVAEILQVARRRRRKMKLRRKNKREAFPS
jgi:hypothetical protein